MRVEIFKSFVALDCSGCTYRSLLPKLPPIEIGIRQALWGTQRSFQSAPPWLAGCHFNCNSGSQGSLHKKCNDYESWRSKWSSSIQQYYPKIQKLYRSVYTCWSGSSSWVGFVEYFGLFDVMLKFHLFQPCTNGTYRVELENQKLIRAKMAKIVVRLLPEHNTQNNHLEWLWSILRIILAELHLRGPVLFWIGDYISGYLENLTEFPQDPKD